MAGAIAVAVDVRHAGRVVVGVTSLAVATAGWVAIRERPPNVAHLPRADLPHAAAVYGIWIFTLILIGFCGCPRLALSARFVLGVTVTSIIVVVAAYGANGFFASRQTSMLLMVQVRGRGGNTLCYRLCVHARCVCGV